MHTHTHTPESLHMYFCLGSNYQLFIRLKQVHTVHCLFVRHYQYFSHQSSIAKTPVTHFISLKRLVLPERTRSYSFWLLLLFILIIIITTIITSALLVLLVLLNYFNRPGSNELKRIVSWLKQTKYFGQLL